MQYRVNAFIDLQGRYYTKKEKLQGGNHIPVLKKITPPSIIPTTFWINVIEDHSYFIKPHEHSQEYESHRGHPFQDSCWEMGLQPTTE